MDEGSVGSNRTGPPRPGWTQGRGCLSVVVIILTLYALYAANQAILRIDVPGQPRSHVIAISQILVPAGRPNPSLPRSLKPDLLFNSVMIMKKEENEDSALTEGNGVLISKSAILTARHVALNLERFPEKYTVHLQDRDLYRTLKPLEVLGIRYLRDGPDPDLALIRITPVERTSFPEFAVADPLVKGRIFVIGCQQFSRFNPDLCTGNVFTTASLRRLSDGVTLTVFGTNTFPFPGVSGSPTYDWDSGRLIGIQYGSGAKGFSFTGSGEALLVIKTPEARWEQEDRFTWIVPTTRYAEQIRSLADEPLNSPEKGAEVR